MLFANWETVGFCEEFASICRTRLPIVGLMLPLQTFLRSLGTSSLSTFPCGAISPKPQTVNTESAATFEVPRSSMLLHTARTTACTITAVKRSSDSEISGSQCGVWRRIGFRMAYGKHCQPLEVPAAVSYTLLGSSLRVRFCSRLNTLRPLSYQSIVQGPS